MTYIHKLDSTDSIDEINGFVVFAFGWSGPTPTGQFYAYDCVLFEVKSVRSPQLGHEVSPTSSFNGNNKLP